MISILWLALYLASGNLITRWLLPRQRTVIRCWLGTALGVMLMMWLPALCAFGLRFSTAAHWVSLVPLGLLTALCWLWRDRQPLRAWNDDDRRSVRLLLAMALPLILLSCWLVWTHDLNPAPDGSLHTGQATYGDLSLHLSIITSLRDAAFPADYAIMPGQRLSYPFLTDSFTTSFMLGGCSLRAALLLSSVPMLALVFAGYTLLCQRLCRTRAGTVLAVLLFFLNGGLGFMYSLDMLYVPLSWYDGSDKLHNALQSNTGLPGRLRTIMDGWYQTPTNHAEFDTYNLRWSNVIADMLIPQRTTMGGWSMLMPCLWLLSDTVLTEGKALADGQPSRLNLRPVVLLGVMAGALPMVHTHSFTALAFCSFGMLLYSLVPVFSARAWRLLTAWGVYAGIAAVLAVPQLVLWTFSQALQPTDGSSSFLAFQFNWVNHYEGGLKDAYLWFYLKNVGLPYLVILLALFQKDRRWRCLFSGAFVIYVIAEFIRFQPNDYDNNKLFYVWYMLCAPIVGDCLTGLWHKLKGVRARPVLAVLCCVVCFLSGSLSVAHECVTDWQLYSAEDVETARYIEENLPAHAVFMTGRQHLNPVASLAGRTIVCGPDLWLVYHGLDVRERSNDIWLYYQDPENYGDILDKYGVDYILVSGWERSDLIVNDEALDRLFPVLYESRYGTLTIYDATRRRNEEE